MFERLDYLIVGEENLPKSSGHLFIMNHLCAHPDMMLPNNFQIILDTHFVSSMILHRKYGEPPIRVVRGAYPSEIGQKAYYDRLGYIVVPPRDERASIETPTKPGEALREFLDRAEDQLAEHHNVVICPEGSCTTSERSPMPFKIGAFALAADARPEPLIVPIALANFDKRVTRTRLVAVIHEPFRLSDKLSETVDRECLREFVKSYRETFRDYVQQARELATRTVN